MRAFILPSLLFAAALSGCASTKDYASAAPKNLTLRADVEAGGFRVSREAQVGIYRMNGKCPMEYLGSVDLDEKPVQIGLETGHRLYLNFLFMQANSRASSTMTWGTVLTPQPGAQYAARVRWGDGMYEARVRETGKGGQVLREFERQSAPCPLED